MSTRKLVDSVDEQVLLEELIERAKPPAVGPASLHYLLATPFRYPPLRHGSRFGARHERGVWYGSETPRTVFAEVAYYRLLFLEGTSADLGALTTQLTAFTARVRSTLGVDLTLAPFDAHRRAISSPSRYASAQALGVEMRQAGVELIRYESARDPQGGINVAAFSPAVFGSSKPRSFETWHCTSTRLGVEVTKRDYFRRESFAFVRESFLVGGALPAPAV
ncbi:MAG TPA: RES family NAD+ phosphorylase [Gemmatimonadaceae bacterium]|nr:RES family NAD+ phosphorylase [Gemmatimonadaceae bacterium]